MKPGNPPQSRISVLKYWLRQSASVLWLAVAALYLSVLAGRALYRNYQSQQQTVSLQSQLDAAIREHARLEALIVYYNTDTYKEKELRQSLLLKEPDEKVYALPESWSEPSLDQQSPIIPAFSAKPTTVAVWRQWLNYVLYGSKS